MSRETIAQPLGRRERKKLKVKERVYSSALALFTERGYDRTSIDEIAEHADVARGTFFNYFQRKEDLVGAWGEQRRNKLRERLEVPMQSAEGSVAVRLERCMTALGDINEEEREITGAMLSAWVKAGRPLLEEPFAAEIFASIVKSGLACGEVSPDVDPERVGNLLRDVYLGTLYRWTRTQQRKGALHEELNAVLQLFLHGLLVTPESHG
ncbi:TetR/AcrR family transcriptional regulator [Streptomyces olivaceiscleroticus]|uniref:TetR/AcrR family transcriptional regulator n=1 Tax=Streptomyces olivaceiscleroticus TaxID=68245 RepID=UPI0031F91F85